MSILRSRTVSQPWHYWCFWLDGSLSWGTVCCIVGCLAVSLSSYLLDAGSIPLPHPSHDIRMSPDIVSVPRGQKTNVRTSKPDYLVSHNSVSDFQKERIWLALVGSACLWVQFDPVNYSQGFRSYGRIWLPGGGGTSYSQIRGMDRYSRKVFPLP